MKAASLIMKALDGSLVQEVSESVVPLQDMARSIRVAGMHNGIPIRCGTVGTFDRGSSRVVMQFRCQQATEGEAAPAVKPRKK